jgi:putative SOS response-associated peptidase YedK
MNVPVIRQNCKEPVRELSLVRWGLIVSWAKDSSVAAKMINVEVGDGGHDPAFRDALKSRRCLIPADGFYEWSRAGKAKTEPWSQALRPVKEKIVRSTSFRVI